MQDDWAVVGELGWLEDALPLFGQGQRVGLAGFDVGVRSNRCVDACRRYSRTHFVPGSRDGCSPTQQDETESGGLMTAAMDRPACMRRWNRLRLVGAHPCVTMGPLLLRRSLFARLGGFDESIFERGQPSSLLDCDLSARVWAAGLAVVLLRVRMPDGRAAKPFVQRSQSDSIAWHSVAPARDYERCQHVNQLYVALGAEELAKRVGAWNDDQLARCVLRLKGRGGVMPPEADALLLERLQERGRGEVKVAGSSARGGTDSTQLSDRHADAHARSRLNLTFAVQYWGGYREPFDDFWGNFSTRLDETVLPMLMRLASAASELELSSETLVNVDSPHLRQGDHSLRFTPARPLAPRTATDNTAPLAL